ncbi:MAG TPA: hypothetical protein VEQ59_04265, partial [Polyangiaceae bacterium]|nr:hypothetical protein [Polyangiaceae bacterium]
MKKLFAALGLLLLAFVRDTPRAAACGGPDVFYPLAVRPNAVGSRSEDDAWIREATFLYPYLVAYPSEAELLWKFCYEDLQTVPAPDSAPFERALAQGQPAAALRAANALIDAWYRLPPVLAAPHRGAMLRAVAYVEQGSAVAPAVSPSRRFLEIMDELKRDVPDGWSSARQQALAPVWSKQLRDTDAWRVKNPHHPLFDLVGFWQVRVLYLSGEYEVAWSKLFALYGRRRPRALAEMRYLAQQGQLPTAAQLDRLKDPLLVALFADAERVTPARAERWWRLSERSSERGAALALQERVLESLAAQPAATPLPSWFPKQPERRSQQWGLVRSVALMQHSRFAEAVAQLELLRAEPAQAALLAAGRVALGQPLAAVGTPGLDERNSRYLMIANVPRDEAVKHLSDENPTIRGEATWTAALERLHARDYAGAAQLVKRLDAEQAGDLERMAALQKSG